MHNIIKRLTILMALGLLTFTGCGETGVQQKETRIKTTTLEQNYKDIKEVLQLDELYIVDEEIVLLYHDNNQTKSISLPLSYLRKTQDGIK